MFSVTYFYVFYHNARHKECKNSLLIVFLTENTIIALNYGTEF